jgi:hypothetical protein
MCHITATISEGGLAPLGDISTSRSMVHRCYPSLHNSLSMERSLGPLLCRQIFKLDDRLSLISNIVSKYYSPCQNLCSANSIPNIKHDSSVSPTCPAYSCSAHYKFQQNVPQSQNSKDMRFVPIAYFTRTLPSPSLICNFIWLLSKTFPQLLLGILRAALIPPVSSISGSFLFVSRRGLGVTTGCSHEGIRAERMKASGKENSSVAAAVRQDTTI